MYSWDGNFFRQSLGFRNTHFLLTYYELFTSYKVMIFKTSYSGLFHISLADFC